MSYKINDLSPCPIILVINGVEIKLSFLTLQKEVEIISNYGSLSEAFSSISKNPSQVIKLIYLLVEDKSNFNTYESFEKFVCTKKDKVDLSEKATLMMTSLDEVINKSMPLIKNKQRYKEIQDMKTTGDSSSEPCYLEYYDSIAKRYSYTLEEFYKLTLRQIHLMLNKIGDKSYEELEISAALQGRKLKPRMKFEDVPLEQEKDQEKQAMQAIKELQKRYQEKQEN